jgi:hypothetical protein
MRRHRHIAVCLKSTGATVKSCRVAERKGATETALSQSIVLLLLRFCADALWGGGLSNGYGIAHEQFILDIRAGACHCGEV